MIETCVGVELLMRAMNDHDTCCESLQQDLAKTCA